MVVCLSLDFDSQDVTAERFVQENLRHLLPTVTFHSATSPTSVAASAPLQVLHLHLHSVATFKSAS